MTDENPNPEDQKPVKELELLVCTAEFYIAMQERSLSAYEAKPISVSYRTNDKGGFKYTNYPMEDLKKLAIEKGFDVVTDLRQIDVDYDTRSLMGIGLKLKQEKP